MWRIRAFRAHLAWLSVVFTLTWAAASVADAQQADGATARLIDRSDGRDWAGYGRTFGQQHYSPLSEINPATITQLGLLWSLDLGPESAETQPIAVDGVLYFATGQSVVHAVDATDGRILWRYDPKVGERAGIKLRSAWGGVRGVAWWNGKIYSGTNDGRLIALNAMTGRPIWSVQTIDAKSAAHVSGAPRVFAGKVIVGFAHAGSNDRGYVTTYDAETGRQLWRFYTVPGNPATGSEDPAMAMAAKTWVGEWWNFGGGNVWNAIAYDPSLDLVYIGTADGGNSRVRSQDEGDNLFIASIVALEGKTGAYRWHYQLNPGDVWDFDAAMDIELADLTIGGKVRKALLQASKNGFFYVIDRVMGQLISAEPYAKVTWASRIDLATGRPVEAPGARYPNGTTVEIWPSGIGAHGASSMAYSPKTALAYIPVIESGWRINDQRTDLIKQTIEGGSASAESSGVNSRGRDAIPFTGALVAWNPLKQQPKWTVPYPTFLNGGILATGGDLVFQGTVDGTLKSYAATTGRMVWSFATQAPVMAMPISYDVHGRQYVTVLTGLGMGLGLQASIAYGERAERYGIDPRSQARRVLTFALGGEATLPPARPPAPAMTDPTFQPDARRAAVGRRVYERYCGSCHGWEVIGSIHAPDLRRSPIPVTADAFSSVVLGGALVMRGMPAFDELTAAQLIDLRQYIRTETARLRSRNTHNDPNP